MKSAWSDMPPVAPIDPDAFLYMGADPAWTPDREYRSPMDADGSPGLCSECGGDPHVLIDPEGRIVLDLSGRPVLSPTAVPVGSKRVCARCMRYGREKAPPASVPSSVPVACEDDPGYVRRGSVVVPERFARMLKG